MADENTHEEGEEARIPRSRLNQEVEKRRDAEKRLAEYESRLADLENRDKSDVERLTKQLETLKMAVAERDQAIQAAETARIRQERSSWLSDAAARLNFHEPAAATRLIAEIDAIEDPRAAEKAVKDLAKQSPYLVKAENAEPRLQRVAQPLNGGTQPAADGAPMSQEVAERTLGANAVFDALAKIGVVRQDATE